MKRFLRITSYTIILFISFSSASSTSIPWLEDFLVSIHVPPIWDNERLKQFHWNNYLAEHGKPPINWRE